MYYIYHVPEEKIGTSIEPETRVANQGYSEFEILEEHTCIYEVSRRERELQEQYGYPVDPIPYWLTIEKFTKKGGWQTGDQSDRARRIPTEARRRGGLTNAKSGHLKNIALKGGMASAKKSRKLTMQQADEIRAKYVPRKYPMLRLAKEYGVSRSVVSSILHNRSYTKKGHSEE